MGLIAIGSLTGAFAPRFARTWMRVALAGKGLAGRSLLRNGERRADARAVQRLISGLTQLRDHRGSELSKISRAVLATLESVTGPQNGNCEFHLEGQGRCSFGDHCPSNHFPTMAPLRWLQVHRQRFGKFLHHCHQLRVMLRMVQLHVCWIYWFPHYRRPFRMLC